MSIKIEIIFSNLSFHTDLSFLSPFRFTRTSLFYLSAPHPGPKNTIHSQQKVLSPHIHGSHNFTNAVRRRSVCKVNPRDCGSLSRTQLVQCVQRMLVRLPKFGHFFNVAFLARPSGSFQWAILENFDFLAENYSEDLQK